mgnify:CR=1 FL=1
MGPFSYKPYILLVVDLILVDSYGNKIGKYKSALLDCNKSLLINPKNGNTYDSRGDVYFALDDKKGACSDYKNAIANGYKQREKYLKSEEGTWCRNMPN